VRSLRSRRTWGAVLTANQALLWAALRAADADPSSVTDYGRLFGHG
jgi:hypothetical protein